MWNGVGAVQGRRHGRVNVFKIEFRSTFEIFIYTNSFYELAKFFAVLNITLKWSTAAPPTLFSTSLAILTTDQNNQQSQF